jgi:hypothetical protein
LFDDYESLPWRRKQFERQALLKELMRKAGNRFIAHFKKYCEKPARMERQLSSISPQSLFFDKHLW